MEKNRPTLAMATHSVHFLFSQLILMCALFFIHYSSSFFLSLSLARSFGFFCKTFFFNFLALRVFFFFVLCCCLFTLLFISLKTLKPLFDVVFLLLSMSMFFVLFLSLHRLFINAAVFLLSSCAAC